MQRLTRRGHRVEQLPFVTVRADAIAPRDDALACEGQARGVAMLAARQMFDLRSPAKE